MDKKLRKALQDAYRVPPPAGKAAFLKRRRRRELGRWELAAVQAGYIRWWVWGASLGLFVVILWGTAQAVDGGLWCAAALTPFLALLAVAEQNRSRLYHMDELELACRMSRQSVFLARLVALGVFHLALLAGLTPALAVWGAVGAAWAGVCLLTPYLLTAALGMELTRRMRGREGLLACGCAAAVVSGLGLWACQHPALHSLPLWWAALAGAFAAAALEVKLNLKGTEELQWN